jgi:hypothetical protein
MKLSIRDNLVKSAGKEERKRVTGLNFDFAEKKLKETESEPSRDLVQKFITEQAGELPFKSEIIERINSLNIERERARYNKEEAFFVIAGSVLTTNSLEAAKARLEDIEEYVVRLELSAGNILKNFFSGIDINKSEDILKIVESYERFYSEVEREKRRVEDEEKNASSSGYKSNEVVHDFGDGWKVVYVPAAGEMEPYPYGSKNTSYDRILEGNKNGLCLGSSTSYYQDNSQGKIYSVRNPDNEPEVTIRILVNLLQEAKGKSNNPPSVDGASHADKWFKLQEDTLNYKSSFDYKNFPPYTKELANQLWENGRKIDFYTKGWVVSWYKNGLAELDEYTRELIEKKSPLIVWSGLGKKYKELAEPVIEHFANEFIQNNDGTIFGLNTARFEMYMLSHESWKTYKKNPLMVRAVQKLAKFNWGHFLKLGLFKINEYYDISKDLIKKSDLRSLINHKIIEDEKWKEECLAALDAEVQNKIDLNSIGVFFELYDILIGKNGSEYLLDRLFSYEKLLLKDLEKDYKIKQLFEYIYSRSENPRFNSLVKKLLESISLEEICDMIIGYNGYNEALSQKIEKEVLSLDNGKIDNKKIPSLINMACINAEWMAPLRVYIIKKISSMNEEEIENTFSLTPFRETPEGIFYDKTNPISMASAVRDFLDANTFATSRLGLIDEIDNTVRRSAAKFIEDIAKITVNNINNKISHENKSILNLNLEQIYEYSSLVNEDESDVEILYRTIGQVSSHDDYLYDKFLDFFIKSSDDVKTLLLDTACSANFGLLIRLVKQFLNENIDPDSVRVFSNYAKLNPRFFFEELDKAYLKYLFKDQNFIIAYVNYICYLANKDSKSVTSGHIEAHIYKIFSQDNNFKQITAPELFKCLAKNDNRSSMARTILYYGKDYIPKELIFEYIDSGISKIEENNELFIFIEDVFMNKSIHPEIYDYFIKKIILKIYSDIEENNNFNSAKQIFSKPNLLDDIIFVFSKTGDEKIAKIFERVSNNLSYLLVYNNQYIDNRSIIKKYISDAAKNYAIDIIKDAENTENKRYAIDSLLSSNIRYLTKEIIDPELTSIIFKFFRENIDIIKKSLNVIFTPFNLINLMENFLETFNLILDEVGPNDILNIFYVEIAMGLNSFHRTYSGLDKYKEKYLNIMRKIFNALKLKNLSPSKEDLKNNLSKVLFREAKGLDSLKYCANETIEYIIDGLYGTEDEESSKKITSLSRALRELGLIKEASQIIRLI